MNSFSFLFEGQHGSSALLVSMPNQKLLERLGALSDLDHAFEDVGRERGQFYNDPKELGLAKF